MKDFWRIPFSATIMSIVVLSAVVLNPWVAIGQYLFVGCLIALIVPSWKIVFAWLPALWSTRIRDWTNE